MKIALVNYHYFINGGPDRYFFNIYRALEHQGHIVVPFCFDYAETFDTPYRSYFPTPITGPGPSLYDQQTHTVWNKITALSKLFHNTETDDKFRLLLKTEKPDLVYMIYLSSTFLPTLIRIARKEFDLPVVYRLSDFHMFCPAYLFCRDGAICTECVDDLSACVRHRCVKGSRLGSIARVAQIQYFRCRNHYNWVETFISPSQFMASFLKEHGFPSEKILALPTFSEDLSLRDSCLSASTGETILFLGNVSREKGIEVLLDAFAAMNSSLTLDIVGKCSQEYIDLLQSRIPAEKRDCVRFRGFLSEDALLTTMKAARYLVHPAIWYENMPNSIIEMMSLGKPILSTVIGSIPGLVEHEGNGLLVTPGDVNALAQAMTIMETSSQCDQYGARSRTLYEKRHTEVQHLRSLEKLFEKLLDRR